MERVLLFGILSLPVIVLSWKTLFKIDSHGFYRFFSWECIVWLLVCNYKYWFTNPFSVNQLFSWIFLFAGAYLVIVGALTLKKKGNQSKSRNEEELYAFEKTSKLVDTGIYKYIRHPLYSSLIFLTWGIYLKNITISLTIISILSTILLFITARFDEKECIYYFGDEYKEYMKKSKMFVPLIF